MKRFIFALDDTLLTKNYNLEKEYFESIYGNDSTKLLNGLSVYLNSYENSYSKYDRDKLCRYLNYVSGLKFTLEILDGWNEVIGNQHCKTEEETIELLEYLKGKGYSLSILTNWFREPQIKKIQNAGLIEYFDDIYTGDEVLKPNKEAYICAKDRFSFNDCVVIGDDLRKDYMVPRELNMGAILYDKTDLQRSSIVKVKRMNEIMEKF